MSGLDVGVAILLLIAFIAGIAGGLVLVVSVASRREDRLHSLTGAAPGPACEGARRLVGAGVLGDHFFSAPSRPYSHGDGDGDADGDTQEWDPDR